MALIRWFMTYKTHLTVRDKEDYDVVFNTTVSKRVQLFQRSRIHQLLCSKIMYHSLVVFIRIGSKVDIMSGIELNTTLTDRVYVTVHFYF